MRVILKVLALGLLCVAGVRGDDGVHVVVAPEEGLLELCPVKMVLIIVNQKYFGAGWSLFYNENQ